MRLPVRASAATAVFALPLAAAAFDCSSSSSNAGPPDASPEEGWRSDGAYGDFPPSEGGEDSASPARPDGAPDGGGGDGEAGAVAACTQLPDDAGQPAILLAQDQNLPVGVAVDGTNVYWTSSGNGTVMRCPLAGCVDSGAPQTLAQGQSSPYAVAVNATNVYWVNFFGDVGMCPIDGCGDAAPYDFPAQNAAGITLDETRIYWTEFSSGVVASCPLTGCTAPFVIYQGPAGPSYGIAVDTASVYWPNNMQGALLTAPITGIPEGGAPRVIAQSDDPNYAAVASNTLFWSVSSSPGSILGAPLSGVPEGGSPTTVAGGLVHPKAIAVDGVCGALYWATTGTTGADGGPVAGAVQRCPLSGCDDGGPLTFATAASPVWVAVDASYVYWADYYAGTIWKRAK